MKSKLTEEMKAYIDKQIKRELNKDPVLESLQYTVAQYHGLSPDYFQDNNALQVWSYVQDTRLKERLGHKFADYFYEQLIKGAK